MKNQKKEFISKEKINPMVLKAVDRLGTRNSVAEKIGKSAMAFSQIKNMQSLPAMETLGAMRVVFGLNINAIIDGDESNLFDEVKTSDLLERIEKLEKERTEYRERAELFEKMLKKVDFNNGVQSNLLVDNLRMIQVFQQPFMGNMASFS